MERDTHHGYSENDVFSDFRMKRACCKMMQHALKMCNYLRPADVGNIPWFRLRLFRHIISIRSDSLRRRPVFQKSHILLSFHRHQGTAHMAVGPHIRMMICLFPLHVLRLFRLGCLDFCRNSFRREDLLQCFLYPGSDIRSTGHRTTVGLSLTGFYRNSFWGISSVFKSSAVTSTKVW